jgi:hypothetical protein
MPVGLGLHPYSARPLVGYRRTSQPWATDQDMMPTRWLRPTLDSPRDGLPVATTALDNVFAGWQQEADRMAQRTDGSR